MTKKEIVKDICDRANREKLMKGSLTQLATKQLPTGGARLSVSVYTNGSPGGSVPGRGLVVSLHHS